MVLPWVTRAAHLELVELPVLPVVELQLPPHHDRHPHRHCRLTSQAESRDVKGCGLGTAMRMRISASMRIAKYIRMAIPSRDMIFTVVRMLQKIQRTSGTITHFTDTKNTFEQTTCHLSGTIRNLVGQSQCLLTSKLKTFLDLVFAWHAILLELIKLFVNFACCL